MNQLHTVEAFVVDAIKQEQLPTEIPGCPMSAEARRLLMAEIPVVVTNPSVDSEYIPFTEPRPVVGYDPSEFSLHQPTQGHQRSFELVSAETNTVWQDEYGNIYGSINLKGNNLSNPGVMKHPTAVDEYIAWGLQESKIIERVLRASAVMRSRGIGTEYIIGLAEPKNLPWPTIDSTTTAYETVSLHEYRQRIVGKYWKELPEEQRTIEQLAQLTEKFNDMTFYVSMRAADTCYRMEDVRSRPTTARAKVFEEINSHQLVEGEEPLDPESQADWVRYLRDYLAPQLGVNLARLHKDLAHGFLHALNVTGLGSIVDLDSVHGEPLEMDDEPVTHSDRAADLFTAAASLHSVGPFSFGNRTNHEIALSFFSSYFAETIDVLGDISAARTQLADTLVAFEDLLNKGQWRDDSIEGVAPQHLKICQLMYANMLFLHENDSVATQFTNLDKVVNKMLQSSYIAEHLLHPIEIAVHESIPDIARDLIDEYINELNDPSYDVVSHFMTNRSSDVRITIRDAIATGLMSSMFHHWRSNASEILSLGDNSTVFQVLFAGHMGMYEQRIKLLSDGMLPRIISKIEQDLRERCKYTRPNSLLPEYESRPSAGIKEQTFWLSTEGVDFSEAWDLVRRSNSPFDITLTGTTGSRKSIVINIENGDKLQEIITDGMVGGSGVTTGESSIELTVEELDQDEAPSYVLCVIETSDNKILLRYFLTDRVNERIKQQNDDERSDEFIQDVLF